jgi:hypothetical protein
MDALATPGSDGIYRGHESLSTHDGQAGCCLYV